MGTFSIHVKAWIEWFSGGQFQVGIELFKFFDGRITYEHTDPCAFFEAQLVSCDTV